MSLTDDMKSLRENIDAAQADRTKWVSDNQKDTKEMLGRFRREHKEMTGVLRRDLGSYVTRILAEFSSDIDGAHAAWIGKAGGETKRKRQKKTEEEGEES